MCSLLLTSAGKAGAAQAFGLGRGTARGAIRDHGLSAEPVRRGIFTAGDFYCQHFLPYSINRRRGVVLGSEPFTVSTLRHDHCAGARASSSCRRSARTSAPACTRRRPARVPDERSWNLAFRWLGLFLAVLSVVMPNDMPLDPEHGTRAGGAKASGGCSRHPRFPAFHRSGLRQAAAIVHRSPLTSARFDWNGRPRKPQTNRSKDSLFPVSFRLFIFVTTIAFFQNFHSGSSGRIGKRGRSPL